MALQDFCDYEDDYVILSDIDSDFPDGTEQFKHSRTLERTKNTINGTNTISNSSRHVISRADGSGTSVATSNRTTHSSRASTSSRFGRSDSDSELEDIEEIEYGYDNDTLLIMPAMLRDYSHHATNYHPELWRAPIPGSFPSQPSYARCRQEDRQLDRAELLQTTISPTTCGICFEVFTPFDLEPTEQLPEVTTSGVHMAKAFTSRLARSFALLRSGQNNAASTATSVPSPTTNEPSTVGETIARRRSSVGTSVRPSNMSTMAGPSPSISSRDIGLIMPCQHGLCLSCLQTFLTNATDSPQARFPVVCPQPNCRTAIPAESAELVLDATTLEIWYRKLAEVHVANKICCPLPDCGSIIDLDDRDGTAVTCPECRSSFCASCAVPFHRGLTCEQYRAQAQAEASEEDRALLQLVKDRHWRHCPSCRFVIEKQQGCNHMVCHCGQTFCYACGDPWDEIEARCSRDCESEGGYFRDDDLSLDCIIM